VILPDGKAWRTLALGQHTTIADWYWLQLAQYLGNDAAREAGWPALYPYAQLITDLDPDYGYAYELAGLLLASTDRLTESDAILNKGMGNAPHRWQIPFYAAFNRWFYRGDLAGAGPLLQRAASLPGSPDYLMQFARDMTGGLQPSQRAAGFLESLLATDPPPAARERILERLKSSSSFPPLGDGVDP